MQHSITFLSVLVFTMINIAKGSMLTRQIYVYLYPIGVCSLQVDLYLHSPQVYTGI